MPCNILVNSTTSKPIHSQKCHSHTRFTVLKHNISTLSQITICQQPNREPRLHSYRFTAVCTEQAPPPREASQADNNIIVHSNSSIHTQQVGVRVQYTLRGSLSISHFYLFLSLSLFLSTSFSLSLSFWSLVGLPFLTSFSLSLFHLLTVLPFSPFHSFNAYSLICHI